ncbi:hypothetical protein [Candidatus Palauibacter sp.]|uniref:hypothetical protein n=1 Tax=Candidatus Palauibacter sp. TaxID=3101350 RepID=UPI003B01A5E1
MSYGNLVRRFSGMSDEEITASWTADPATLDEVVAAERRELAKSVLTGVKERANAGDMAAIEWLASVNLIDRDRPRTNVVEGIIAAALDGDAAAAEWLQSKELLDISLAR